MNELQDRLPETGGPDFANPEVASTPRNEEEDKVFMEMLEKMSMMNRRDRRKIIKPTFSKDIKKAFRKKVG